MSSSAGLLFTKRLASLTVDSMIYSITSSARASKLGERLIPSDLSARVLAASQTDVGNSIGRSPGFAEASRQPP